MVKKKAPLRVGETHVQAVRDTFPGAVLDAAWQAEDQVTVTVPKDMLPDVVEFLYYGRGGWLPNMVANDERPINGNYALYYLLSMEESDPGFVTVRAEVDPQSMEYPSVTPRVPACVWSEREAFDLFGLRAQGLPDERRLVLPDDWPADLYPLRKDSMDYRKRPAPVTDVENYSFLYEGRAEEVTEVPMGPLHITSDEPGHFRLFVEGEEIIDADYRLFYVHRGMEKVAESRLNYDAVTFLADRICGICGNAHSVAYAEAVEHAQGIEVPVRAQYIRAILLEVERLHSHLLNLGLVCHYCGFDTGFQHFFRVREKTMDLAVLLTGARKTYGLNLIGGVRRDILDAQKVATIKYVREIRNEVEALVDMLVSTANFESRTAGVGRLDPAVARDYSPVGPCVRGSGIARDVRFDHPFDGYKYLSGMKARSHDGCDVQSRTLVRVEEFMDSLTMIEQLLDGAPAGPVLTEDWRYTPHKFALGYTEAPRGEDMHWAQVGDNQKCYRWRAKAATYSNWPILRYMFRGNTVADAAIIVGSMDPCYSCTDRVTVVDVKKKTETVLTKDQLEGYCRRRTHSPLSGTGV
ncbi:MULTISPECIES: NADH-quinone oxidoreductase subunit C [Adlercreutzia]|mgnify:FL=1|jgi:formate hydrogenlyase subunit 5|uniref:Hydrogenase large subunit n=2 Tax=Adlercreutzia TaxID=447020 RepID=A0A6N8JP01_9ACTN|nr:MULTISPECIES: hydrogenase large subunit [Adlercreutzia]MCI9673643.1 hydrogenase large subunit [Enterorhabdus sp.]TGY68948.1 hydrogenase large subunit [Enterorhabdus sp. NM05_H27]MVX61693.1 hydrogenase large subunit [Adlercreutzia mucosicola]NBJ67324.1 hydrogenase large subunit [Adlercreutzia caecimuris]NCA33020.1 hydrogenase large subunit [Adlercreutzia muris]